MQRIYQPPCRHISSTPMPSPAGYRLLADYERARDCWTTAWHDMVREHLRHCDGEASSTALTPSAEEG